MSSTNVMSNRGGSNYKRKDKIADKFKAACPPHRQKDLEPLVKALKGDEDKIRATIEEWWDEPEKVEPEWEDVNKKSKKTVATSRSGSYRGSSSSGGRGYSRGSGGRGFSRERVGGRGERRYREDKKFVKPVERPPVGEVYSNPPAVKPKSAWTGESKLTDKPDSTPIFEKKDVGGTELMPQVVCPRPPATGNVWATKGSAHLIEAEKPKPPVRQPISAPQNKDDEKNPQLQEELGTELLSNGPISPDTEEHNLVISPPSHSLGEDLKIPDNGNAWKLESDVGLSNSPHLAAIVPPEVIHVDVPEEEAAEEDHEVPFEESQPEPVIEQSEQPKEEVASSSLPAGILNMGKWDSEADEAGLDFGFGSFGHESDQPEAKEEEEKEPIIPQEQITQLNPPPLPVEPPTVSASPARPPPGLSITGMPPMPANAVLVHELENKLDFKEPPAKKEEDTTQPPADKATSTPAEQQPQPNYPEPSNPVLPGMSQYTAVYGMGMYNYNPSSLGNFVGVHTPAGPVLATGALPKQNTTSQLQNTQSNLPSQHHQQGGLYGAPATSVSTNQESGASSETSNSALPPGIAHGAIPYNPALYHGQQYYQMGQPHGGYGYGYGQYTGVQGGFGYQQVMGQNNYQPYDDQHLSTQHSSNTYQKSATGYRSRSHHNSHTHGNHQYQNQYTPQQAYAAQPYMAYSVDHFSQRGTGYGPDPYMQQGSAYQSNTHSGYSSQEEDLQLKGKQRQQQFLQGSGTSESNNAGGGGWNNPRWVATNWQGN